MISRWIVVADTSRARFFSAESAVSPLEEIEDMVHGEGRLHDREITEDLPGKIKNPNGIGGHAFEQPTDPKKHAAENFALRIAHYLEDAFDANRFNHLLVVAEPSMLGLLRKMLPDKVKRQIAFELDKNLTSFDPAEIRKHLPEHTS